MTKEARPRWSGFGCDRRPSCWLGCGALSARAGGAPTSTLGSSALYGAGLWSLSSTPARELFVAEMSWLCNIAVMFKAADNGRRPRRDGYPLVEGGAKPRSRSVPRSQG